MPDSSYIAKVDYKYMMRTERLDQILEASDEDEDAILDSAENDALGVVRNALSPRYNMDIEFGKSGDARNKVVLRWAKVLVIYYIFERIPDEMVPDRVVKNYNDTLEALKRVEDGKSQVVGLTPVTVTDDLTGQSTPKTRFRWGSVPKRSNDGGSPGTRGY